MRWLSLLFLGIFAMGCSESPRESLTVRERTEVRAADLEQNEYANLLITVRVEDEAGEEHRLLIPVLSDRIIQEAAELRVGDVVTLDQFGEDEVPEKWRRAQRLDGLSLTDLQSDVYGLNAKFVSRAPIRSEEKTSDPDVSTERSLKSWEVAWEGGLGEVEARAMSAASYLEPVNADGISPAEAITQLARAVEAKGLSFIYLSIPLRSEIYPEWFGIAGEEPNSARDEVLEALADRGVEVFDAGEVLRREKSEEGDEFRPFWQVSDSHLTPQGHAVIARELGRYLSEKGWLAEVQPEGFAASEIVLEAPGDASLSMTVRQVPVPKTNPQSPIFMAGDSNLYFYQTAHATGCGLPSQLAAETGHYVDWKSIAGMQPHTFGKYGAGVFHGKKLVIFVHTAWLLHDERSPMLPVTLQAE